MMHYKTPSRERIKTPSLSDSDDKSKDTVKVFCRLRPLKDDRESTCIKLISPTVLCLTTPPESKQPRKELHCKFQHIFTAYASQNEIFEHVAYPLLEGLLHGKNGLLFTYGVTGSGKTYTLSGDHNNPGIMPKSIYTIFNTIADYQAPKYVIKSDRMNGFEIQTEEEAMQDKFNEIRKAPKTPKKKTNKDRIYLNDNIKIVNIDTNHLYSVFVSYIEIYNNIVYDLLDENTTPGKPAQGKILREDSQKNMYVNGVAEVEVKSAEEAFEMFNQGQRRKRMGNTLLNSESSRSHSIFNIRVVQFQQFTRNEQGGLSVPEANQLKVAQLSLVDLAGSERTSRTHNTGRLLKEASQINNSLLTLRTCLDVLRENQQTGSNRLVPYRDSRLTLLFKNYFEGEGSIEMIVCVNPSADDFEENLQVMKFAEITQDVKIGKTDNRYTPYSKVPKTNKNSRTDSSSGLGPSFPSIEFDIDNFNDAKNVKNLLESLDKLASAFRVREERVVGLEEEINYRETHFRKRLLEFDQDYILTKNDLKSNKVLLKKEKMKSYNLESKLVAKDAENKVLVNKNEELINNIRHLKYTINEKELKINKNALEKERIKQQLALASEKMSHELDAKLRRQREHLQAEMKAKDNKIRKVKEMLEKDYVAPEYTEEIKENYHMEAEVEQTPQRSRARVVATPGSSNRYRRSRSVGAEVWLEHNAVKPVPLGTVLQPSMKKRKSVTKLNKASDVTNPKQSKYCLIAQEQDVDGEVETKVYKGDILPTTGGGAQVIFNDVERLRQESPTRAD